ncbi:unnamed protein product [Vitrella brassicaformis CCMP3155]|uniref:Oxidation resistance protein 1 n=1 Tax=Vitrella brassicaformis (strain CCMP3155) TaxID=1169540 RepID=A0A0G4EMF3_VITBC|nr:unnamed protein product [Vitrella brassicaformis CCMP3155]|eukprot:CEL98349.1 unnamed protein product [Vitrella brassicaformis CCMP3155]
MSDPGNLHTQCDGPRAVEEGHHDGDEPQAALGAGLSGDTAAALQPPPGWPQFFLEQIAADVAAGVCLGVPTDSLDVVTYAATTGRPPLYPLPRTRHTHSAAEHHPTPRTLQRRSSRRRATSVDTSRRTGHRSDSQACRKNADEVTIGERLQLVSEFERRQRDGEAISMPQFAKENGIPPARFKQWCIDIKKQREAGVEVIDSNKKRNRQPKYQPIEDEMRQWMAGHEDPSKVPPKAIRTKAVATAIRLGITGFSASDSWIKAFRKRCQQDPPGPSESPAPFLAEDTNDMQIPLPSSEPPVAAAAAGGGTDGTNARTSPGEHELDAAVQETPEEAPVSAMQPPHPHPPPRPLTHQSAAHSAPAAAASREADRFIGPIPGVSRQTTTCPPDDDAAASNRPLDEQSQTSDRNTISMAPSESRLTNERPPNKIHRTDTRSHREGPPSVVLSRSSVKSVFTMTADDRLSDIAEDDGDAISVSDGVPDDITALSSRSTTDGDNQSPDPQVVAGSSLSEAECAALHSVLALAMFDECEFTLLYRASRDGAEYGDLLRCVGDTSGLVFVIRRDKYVFGAFISGGLQLPDDARGYNTYGCDVWFFSLSGHFAKGPTKLWEGKWPVFVAERGGLVGGAKLWIGVLGVGLWLGDEGGVADDMRSCRQFISSDDPIDDVPDGYVGVRDEDGGALFGGSEHFMADEVEVIRVHGRSLLSLKVIEGATFDALQSAALCRFVGPTTARRLKLIYRASRDGPSFDDLFRCVGDATGLVFVIRRDKYVFSAFISAGIRLPDDPRGENGYECDVWYFSLAGHFAKGPTKVWEGKWRVCVAGREGTVDGAKLWIGVWLCLGYEGGAAGDVRSCRQLILNWVVPDGYVGVRNDYGYALFGGSEEFMADEVEVLTLV